MKCALRLAAIGCSVILVEAGSFKWNANNGERRWAPAYETLGVMPLLGSGPAPTSPPNLAEARHNKRSATDNTCGYISGDADIPLYCNADSACVYNSVNSNIGCCPDTSTTCALWTTCLDSTDASLYTTDNGYTLWCGETKYPYCITHLYEDNLFTGYTLYGCAVAAGTDSVDYSATLSSSSAGGSSLSVSGLQTSLDVASTTVSAARSSATASHTSPSSSPTNSVLPAATTGSKKGSSTPIGAIVGGVVGGVAVVALFALALVLFLRRKRRGAGTNGGPSAQQPPADQPGGYPPQPPPGQPAMQQYHQQQSGYQPSVDPAAGYAGAAPVAMDNRSSVQKPGYVYNATQSMYDPSAASPPSSPPPPHSQGQSPGSMLPAYQVSNTSAYTMTPQSEVAYGAPQGHGMGAAPTHQQHPGGNYYEMPTEPADREPRELA